MQIGECMESRGYHKMDKDQYERSLQASQPAIRGTSHESDDQTIRGHGRVPAGWPLTAALEGGKR